MSLDHKKRFNYDTNSIVYQKFTVSNESFDDGQNIPVVITPFGIMPAEMDANFRIWIGHTNFNVTDDILQKINKTEGVEALKPLTRYKFAVGIGKLFDENLVKKEISETVASLLSKPENPLNVQNNKFGPV